MNNLRSIAALLLVLTGLIHISLYFEMVQAPDTILVLAFGILYCVIGAVIYKKAKYSAILGIVFPALGLIGGMFVLDPDSMDTLLRLLLLLIDLGILACCVILLVRKEPEA